MRIRIADFSVDLCSDNPSLPRFCAGFETEDPPDISVSVGEEEIAYEQSLLDDTVGRDDAERNALYRKIAEETAGKKVLLLHAAVIEFGGAGYAFSAASGVGKSTHIRYWKELYGDRVTVINGDKPLVREIDGTFYAYGTPWCGKEGQKKNARVPLRAICFLERAELPSIEPISPLCAANAILPRTVIPGERACAEAALDTIDRLVGSVRAYRLGVSLSPESARVARKGLTGDEN